MAQLSVNIPDDVYQWLRGRVTADITLTTQTLEALEDYRRREQRAAAKESARLAEAKP